MKILKVLLMAVLFFSTAVIAESYSVPLQKANWKIKKNGSTCQLKQNIPSYGTAEFMHESAGLLRFSIIENQLKADIVKASLAIASSPWAHNSSPAKEYPVYLDDDMGIKKTARLSVYGKTAEKMLNALSNGRSPTFNYIKSSASGLLPETKVTTSAINFSKSYQKFVDCRKNFLPYGIKDELEKSLFFKPRSLAINTKANTQLLGVVKYIKQVKGSKVIIASNTAVAGGRDKRWFFGRAKALTAKLNKLGVPNKKISIKNGIYAKSANLKILQLKVFGPDALTAIYYRKGSVRLTKREKQQLKLIVNYAQTFMPNAKLVVKSHTDSIGKRANNLAVSRKRGAAVKRYLLEQGMKEGKVIVRAYGETKPAKSNRFPRGRIQNRRVIIGFVV